jgi:uncharacterized protein (DUF1800 family)
MIRIAVLVLPLLLSAAAAASAPDAPRPLSEDEKARMVLDRLAFGARPGEVEQVRKMGVDAWIRQQLEPARIPDDDVERRVAELSVPRQSTAQLLATYRRLPDRAARAEMKKAQDPKEKARLRDEAMQEALADGYRPQQQVYPEMVADRMLRATYSERQLQEVMVDFWSNHFNIYEKKGVLPWYVATYDREVIRPHALGKFRDLLLATARSPAMLYYLDNFKSVAMPEAKKNGPERSRRGINENYARELMELHTLGVDGGYTQQDVREVARAFTGWTIADERGRKLVGSPERKQQVRLPPGLQPGEFWFNPRLHDPAPKTVLGQRIDAGGEADGIAVIDLLARQPSTAKFIAHKLCVKFANDTPDPAMEARVAAAFMRTDGDIRATLSALFSDPAFFTSRNYRAKVKSPFELVASSLRALGAQTDGIAVNRLLTDLGQPLYRHRAPDGYSEKAQDWVNAGALLKRMNFAVVLAGNRIPGTRVELTALGDSGDARAQLDAGLQSLLGGQVSEQSRQGLVARLEQPIESGAIGAAAMGDSTHEKGVGKLLAASGDPQRVQVAALILGSPDFQRQ